MAVAKAFQKSFGADFVERGGEPRDGNDSSLQRLAIVYNAGELRVHHTHHKERQMTPRSRSYNLRHRRRERKTTGCPRGVPRSARPESTSSRLATRTLEKSTAQTARAIVLVIDAFQRYSRASIVGQLPTANLAESWDNPEVAIL